MVTSTVALFCDSIRREQSGTSTIVGVHGDSITPAEFPITIPRLGIYIRITFPVDEAPESIVCRIYDDEDHVHLDQACPTETITKGVARNAEQDLRVSSVIFAAELETLEITSPAKFFAEVVVNGTRQLAGALAVKERSAKTDD